MCECNCTNIIGCSFLSMLQILFIGFKIGMIIEWSWWWVLSPIWLTPLVLTLVLITAIVFYVVRNIFSVTVRKRDD